MKGGIWGTFGGDFGEVAGVECSKGEEGIKMLRSE